MTILGNWVWVKPIYPSTTTDTGIILTPWVPKPTTGVVTGIGNKCDMIMLKGLKEGDVVSFNPDHIRVEEDIDTGEERFRFKDINLDYIL